MHPTTQQFCLPSIFVLISRAAKSDFLVSRRVFMRLQSVTTAVAERLAGERAPKKAPTYGESEAVFVVGQ